MIYIALMVALRKNLVNEKCLCHGIVLDGCVARAWWSPARAAWAAHNVLDFLPDFLKSKNSIRNPLAPSIERMPHATGKAGALMKIGLSTYSLSRAMAAREMTLLDSLQWIADNGGEHVEVATVGIDLRSEPDLPEKLRERAAQLGLEISSYTVGAQFLQPNDEAFDAEIQRMLGEVEIAARLGVRKMRHDVATRPPTETGLGNLEQDMPRLAHACRIIADHAGLQGITTSLENHGFYLQHSDRVRWLVETVDRPNFRVTLDVGNFLCVDEDPLSAVKNLLGLISHVHAKDFYLRPASSLSPGGHWFQSRGGNYLRGAIVGHGDLDMAGILKAIKGAGYDDYLSIEFEGAEDCRLGSRLGMENARRIWESV